MTDKTNFVAVIVAAIAYWILGAVWFTVLANPWAEGIGKTQEQIMQAGSPIVPYFIALASNLVMAFVLAWVVVATGEQSASRGIKLGALMGLGLVAAAMGTEFAFERRSLQIFLIIGGYPLAGLALMGAIVGGWRRKAA